MKLFKKLKKAARKVEGKEIRRTVKHLIAISLDFSNFAIFKLLGFVICDFPPHFKYS